jgi:hypothetical protein
MRRHIPARDPRTNQKTRKSHNPVQMRPTRRCVPSHPVVPRRQMQR